MPIIRRPATVRWKLWAQSRLFVGSYCAHEIGHVHLHAYFGYGPHTCCLRMHVMPFIIFRSRNLPDTSSSPMCLIVFLAAFWVGSGNFRFSGCLLVPSRRSCLEKIHTQLNGSHRLTLRLQAPSEVSVNAPFGETASVPCNKMQH